MITTSDNCRGLMLRNQLNQRLGAGLNAFATGDTVFTINPGDAIFNVNSVKVADSDAVSMPKQP